jgi:hypothetical protein
MKTPRIALAAVLAVAAATAALATPAAAADDGILYRLTSGNVQCTDSGPFMNPPGSTVEANYPAGTTLLEALDTGSGFGADDDISFALDAGGQSGIVEFFGFGISLAPPSSVTLRLTLIVGGTPTYQQTFSFTCPNAVPDDVTEAGTLTIISENTFPFDEPPATGSEPAAAIEAQPRTTG